MIPRNKISTLDTILILKEIIVLELMNMTKNDAKVLQNFVHGVTPDNPKPTATPENPHGF